MSADPAAPQPSPSPLTAADVIAYPQATWTSFDRYSRYAALAQAVRATKGPGPLRVLDVGDSAGHLHLFDPDLWVVGVDVVLADKPLPETVAVNADGTRLPFAADTFDAVVSSDVLEHVPPAGRPAFLVELARVSRDVVAVAAPFDTAGVAGCEDLARRYALFSAAAPQPQLEEHRQNGLPSLPQTVEALEAAGSTVVTVGNGNLWDWLVMMVLRFQLEARPDLRALSEGYDVWYNEALAGRAHLGPFYRHVVVASSQGVPQLGEAGPPVQVDRSGADWTGLAPPELAAVLGALVAANSTEVVRHDARQLTASLDGRFDEQVTRTDHLAARLDILGDRLDHLGERLEALIDLEVSMAEQIRGLLRPLAKATQPFRRKPTQ
jgi:SAM-dependent methyltransferase